MKTALSTLSVILLTLALHANAQIRHIIPPPFVFEEKSDTVSICIIGDVMMHERQLGYDCSSFLANLKPLFEDSDFALANMEFSLGGKPYSGYPAFSAPDSYAEYVAGCGVNVFLTANNHILDRGRKGMERTLSVYRSMSDRVSFTGSASDEKEMESANPLIVFRKGISIALINFTYGTNFGKPAEYPRPLYMDRKELSEAVERARERGADFIIALPHWGPEYVTTHSKNQEEWAEWLVGQGIDAIVGSHPHVVQDSSHIQGVPVIYSVGNAVSNMSKRDTRLELAVRIRFVKKRFTNETKMLEPELIPLWCSLPGYLCGSYCTIPVKEWATRRSEWLNPYDYDNMVTTVNRVSEATGLVLLSGRNL